MSGICLATRGYICCGAGGATITGPGPGLDTEDLRPEIVARSTDAPTVVVQTIPELKPAIKPVRRKKMRRAA